ncbi:MAG: ABC-F family ATP-binding cassette domain-containing protein [Bacteroidales bacterium]|nr:ABC-F family ATP-binding cassette domain-containing protein [Bacteroidales bacterium]
MLSVSNVSVHFTGEYIFRDISFFLTERDRAGLIGKNGAGKTTLLNVIAKEMEAEKGVVSLPSGARVGFLKQQIPLSSSELVKVEAMKAFKEVNDLKEQAEKLTDEIATRTDYESEEYLNLIDRLNHVNERFDILGGNTTEADTEKVLMGLGFERSDFQRPLSEFSGGWRMRVELAKILLEKPEVLLLDEPTNHLDILSITWLENFLKAYSGAVMIVSHDRAFLDAVTNRTIEISLGRIIDYKASYSDYVLVRQEQMETQRAAMDNQQRQIAEIERFVERFRYKSTKSKQVQSRVKMLEKMDRIEVDNVDTSAIHFRFPPAKAPGKIVFEAKDLSKSYGEKLVLDNLELVIKRNDFVAFVGRNGEGKSTLSKIIVENLEHSGEAIIGHNVTIGYFAQNQAELLDPNKTVFETIDDVATGDLRTKVKNLLGSFLFAGEDLEKKVKVLSGGEKSRLAICQMLLTPVNFLVLDEPTNHLDMTTKDILKQALLKYDGTVVVVSHDRDFLQGLTNKVFEFRNKKIREHIGDVYNFLSTREMEDLKELEKMASNGRSNSKDAAPTDNKLSFERQKQFDRDLRKIQKKIDECEQEIARLESSILEMDQIMAEPEKHAKRFSQGDIYQEYNQMKMDLESQMEAWEEHSMEIEELKEQFGK